MDGDGEHQVVVLRRPCSRRAAAAPARSASSLSTAAASAVGRRRQDAPAAVEQLGEAGFGAGMLGAGDRVAGNEMHALAAHAGRTSRITASLTEPTSVTGCARLRGRARSPLATSPQAPTGVQRMTRSAPSHGLGESVPQIDRPAPAAWRGVARLGAARGPTILRGQAAAPHGAARATSRSARGRSARRARTSARVMTAPHWPLVELGQRVAHGFCRSRCRW